MARILRGGKRVVFVVQRCTIHLDDLSEEHVQVELHGHDVVLGQVLHFLLLACLKLSYHYFCTRFHVVHFKI